jgi:CheY-like chemotaxis protein
MAKLSKEKYLILMVDDSADDCLLIRMAVGNAGRLHFIGSVSDGEELMAYLQGSGQYSDRIRFPIPDLLLLDLMMPRKNGFEVLKWLQTQPFEDMIVVVLSGSNHPGEAKQAIELGANYYQSKHADSQHRTELIDVLQRYLSQGEPGSG